MTRSATRKLSSYLALTALSLFGGLAAGRPELVVIATPLVLVVIISLSTTSGPRVGVSIRLSDNRVLEGDELDVTFTLESEEDIAEVEFGLVVPPGLESVARYRTVALDLRGGEPAEHRWRLRAERWGAHQVGLVAVRVPGPGRLITFEDVIDLGQSVHVYPLSERVTRSVVPSHTQIYSGDYVARSAGDGIEFATVRPFVRGDSVRRVNWRVTSRTKELHVNLAHPERDADVVLFLDTFSDIHLREGTTLDLTVRGASALAQYHLIHNDRVGLISFGGMLRWLNASMGRTHTYRIAEFILDVNATFSYAWKDIELLPPGTIPPSALVVAFSPLVDDRAIRALADIGARGFSLVVVNTLAEDQIRPLPGPEGTLAYRVWKLQRQMARDEFRARGTPVVTWSGEHGIQAALAQIPRRNRRVRATIR
jgi:uncharacterized protein (DUF58 family)